MVKKSIIVIIIILAIILFFAAILSIPFFIDFDLNPTCGNDVQDPGEDEFTCAEDFGATESGCGNNVCDSGEDMRNCPSDCGFIVECGDAKCDNIESKETCPQDCGVTQSAFESCNFGDDWIKEYDCLRKLAGIEDKYLAMDWDYDFDDPGIQGLIEEAKQEKNAREATKNIGKQVFDKVDYDAGLSSGKDCTKIKASEVLERGWGWCSTMGKVNIATLRGLGIASRPATGCLTFIKGCARFAVIQGIDLPKTEPVHVEDGKYPTAGGLHAWIEVWLPNLGWTLLEATNGALLNPQCVNYARFKEAVRLDREDFCFVSDPIFAQFCAEF